MNKGLTLRMNQCPVKRQWPRLFEHVRNGYLKPMASLSPGCRRCASFSTGIEEGELIRLSRILEP
jgi:hypothetical protein